MPMRNAEIAAAMAELGTLYELDGANRYRVIAYKEAARVIRQSPVSVEELALAGKATELPGIGDTLQEKIVALVETGEIPAAAKLKAKFPASLIEVTRIPGLGAKTVRKLYDELGVDQPRRAARGGRGASGSGRSRGSGRRRRRTCSRRSRSSARRARPSGCCSPTCSRSPRSWPRRCATTRPREAVEVAGSARRRAETCKDIDLIATAERPEGAGGGADRARARRRRRAPPAAPGPGSRPTTGSRSTCGSSTPDAYGNLLQHFTGSAAAQHRPARARGEAWGSRSPSTGSLETESGEVERYATEAEVYERLGLAYIEPELREGNGEIAAAADGRAARAGRRQATSAATCTATRRSRTGATRSSEMAEGAQARGYAYLAITDHSASHGFGNHVTADQLLERVEEIAAYNAASKGRFRLLAGSEVNIRPDGSLDYEPEVLERLDWVVASVHTSFRISPKKMTERVIAAIENPQVDCIGHLTGRLIGRREPYEIDVEAVAEAAAAETGR